MFGKKVVMNPLQARKRLLLAESDINRELLAHEWDALSAGARQATQTLRQVGSVALSVGALAASFSLFRKPHPPAEKSSWLSRLVKGVRFGLSLWALLGAKRQETFPLRGT